MNLENPLNLPTIHVTGKVLLKAWDHEWGPIWDQTKRDPEVGYEKAASEVSVDLHLIAGIPVQQYYEIRAGGEVRLEVTATYLWRKDSDNLEVRGVAKLFEGTSDSSWDLDGQKDFKGWVRRGQGVGSQSNLNPFAGVHNTDESTSGDYAEAYFDLTF
ncbi:hypothetical protein SAMN05444920_104550 [Nonomuraea solani]|uniref:Uncharacterized protein n=1 Tax=Nonomuraea solani TaxID=1144553 RepID=A0A1H6CZ06_9ACTN|nr:hypothetical protein [Nonomuraea solani]SEG77984.1 hypothetical protein SAMN05444920_104550 [Nonomuraea solani]